MFYTFVTVSHICTPFIALELDKSLAIWRDVYFAPLILILSILALGQLVPLRQRSQRKEDTLGGYGGKEAEVEAKKEL